MYKDFLRKNVRIIRFTQCITVVLLKFENDYDFLIQRVKLHRKMILVGYFYIRWGTFLVLF
jgi:hypothetical protein